VGQYDGKIDKEKQRAEDLQMKLQKKKSIKVKSSKNTGGVKLLFSCIDRRGGRFSIYIGQKKTRLKRKWSLSLANRNFDGLLAMKRIRQPP
jgi:hypothetical protein